MAAWKAPKRAQPEAELVAPYIQGLYPGKELRIVTEGGAAGVKIIELEMIDLDDLEMGRLVDDITSRFPGAF